MKYKKKKLNNMGTKKSFMFYFFSELTSSKQNHQSKNSGLVVKNIVIKNWWRAYLGNIFFYFRVINIIKFSSRTKCQI
jgi:hypothetical protein